jgi:PAS domain S-box-containing protein
MLAAILDASPGPVHLKDASGKLLYVNLPMAEVLRRPAAELVGKNIAEVHPDARQLIAQRLIDARVLLSGEDHTSEVSYALEGGLRTFVEVRRRVSDAEGVHFVLTVATDITERKQFEAEMREANERLELALKGSRDGIWELDFKTGRVRLSERFSAMLGYAPGDLDESPLAMARLLHPDDSERAAAAMADHVDRGIPYEIELRMRHKDGSFRWVLARGQAMWDHRGVPLRMSGSHSDISEHKRALDDARDARTFFETILDQLPLAVFVKSADPSTFGRYRLWNKRAVEMFDLEASEVIGLCEADIFNPDHAAAARDEDERVCDTRAPLDIPVEEVPTRAQGMRQIRTVKAPIFDTSGEPLWILGISEDVSERIGIERSLRSSEERFRAISEASPLGIFVTDPVGGCIYTNTNYERVAGLGPGRAIGTGWSDAVHPDDQSAVFDAWMQAAQSGSLFRSEHRYLRRDGRIVWGSVHATAMIERNVRIGYVGTIEDISERKAAENDLKSALARAEEASRVKSQFLANMSHEIRTPMNGVLGMTALALETLLTAEQREYITAVQTCAVHLLEIINDILDISKIEAGKLELERVAFSLRDTVREPLRVLASRARERGIDLVMDVDADVRDRVAGDPLRLRQIITNLVGNALKFTSEGEIIVRVARAADVGADAIHVSVVDSGIGIPQDKLETIFVPFTQADGTTTRRFGGTGLGLTICRELATRMGGRVWAESGVGQGSTFHFTALLPRASESSLPIEPFDAGGARVVVVGERAASRIALQRALLSLGAECQIGTPAEADALIDPQTALVIIDAAPQEDDVSAAVALARRAAPQARVAVLSLGKPTAPQEGDLHEVDKRLLKPVSALELRELLTVRPLRGLSSPRSDAAPPTTDLANLRVLLAEDNLINTKLARRILEKMGCVVTHAENGLQAVERWASEPVDLILMDVQMPQMDGLEATRTIRSREAGGERVPIIALTANAMKGDDEACTAAGMDDYVPKPIDRKRLEQAMRMALRRRYEVSV